MFRKPYLELPEKSTHTPYYKLPLMWYRNRKLSVAHAATLNDFNPTLNLPMTKWEKSSPRSNLKQRERLQLSLRPQSSQKSKSKLYTTSLFIVRVASLTTAVS
jgi:hypothetical protein